MGLKLPLGIPSKIIPIIKTIPIQSDYFLEILNLFEILNEQPKIIRKLQYLNFFFKF